jgi:hypothetical protein
MSLLICLGSGQKPYPRPAWTNVDIQPKWNPDIVADGSDLKGVFEDGSADCIVIEHSLEHYGCGEADKMLKECYRVLKKGGSLVVTVPDLRELASGLVRGKITDETYCIVLYGAFMGDEADRHKFGFTAQTLTKQLRGVANWDRVETLPVGWQIEGSKLSRDWWICALKAVK